MSGCPRCRQPYAKRPAHGPREPSVDHILPQMRGGRDTIHGDTRNTERMCRSCNMFRAVCGHCWAIVACVDAIARGNTEERKRVVREWRLGPKPQYLSEPESEPVRVPNDAYIFPADTPAKRVWNLAVLVGRGEGLT